MIKRHKLILCLFVIFMCAHTLNAQTFSPLFETGPNMNVARMNHQAVILTDQSVFLIGGHGTGFESLSSCELFSTDSDSFSALAMNYAHDGGAVARLQNGKFLIAGGAQNLGVAPGYNSAEIYDPANNNFSPTGTMNYARTNSVATTLTDGRILVVGGWYSTSSGGYGEIYDPSTGFFTLTGALNTARSNPIALATQDSGAIVFSGIPIYGGSIIQQVEYYDPSSNTFSILKDNLFSAEDPDWLPMSFESYNRQMEMQQIDDENYLFMAYKKVADVYYYTLFTVNIAEKTISRLSTKTELVNSNTHYFSTVILDKNKNVAYLPAQKVGTTTTELDLFAVNLQDSTVWSPDNTHVFPESYYLGTASFQLLADGRILLSGGHSETGNNTNFSPINNTLLINPNYQVTAIKNVLSPVSFELAFDNYPNPFNSSTVFTFNLSRSGMVTLEIFNELGQLIKRVAQQELSQGKHTIKWDANRLASGNYFCRLTTAQGFQFRKISLIK
jgi:hypothetical protein